MPCPHEPVEHSIALMAPFGGGRLGLVLQLQRWGSSKICTSDREDPILGAILQEPCRY